MTQASFYLLAETVEYYPTICRLVEKIYRMQMPIYLFCNNRTETMKLDQLLWEFRNDSFIPHEIYDPKQESTAPILLGDSAEITPPKLDILLNLSTSVPDFYTEFTRIVEVVGNDSSLKQLCREKYKYYQNNGVKITTHHVN